MCVIVPGFRENLFCSRLGDLAGSRACEFVVLFFDRRSATFDHLAFGGGLADGRALRARCSIALRSMTRLKFSSAIRLRNFRDLILIGAGHPSLISSGSRSQRQIDMAVTPNSFCTCGSGTSVSWVSTRGGHGAAPFLEGTTPINRIQKIVGLGPGTIFAPVFG